MKAITLILLATGLMACGNLNLKKDDAKEEKGVGKASKHGYFRATMEWINGPKANEWSEAKITLFTKDSKKPTNPVEILKFEPIQPGAEAQLTTLKRIEWSLNHSVVHVEKIWLTSGGTWKFEMRARVGELIDTVTFTEKDIVDVMAPAENQKQPELGKVSEKDEFRAELEWLVEPEANRYLEAKITFYDTNSQPIKGKVTMIAFDPTMPSMNHGTETRDQNYAIVGNLVTVSGIWLIMGGDWLVEIKAKVNGRIDSVFVEVPDV